MPTTPPDSRHYSPGGYYSYYPRYAGYNPAYNPAYRWYRDKAYYANHPNKSEGNTKTSAANASNATASKSTSKPSSKHKAN